MESTNYVEILMDEIALEGLDGITLPSLWLRLEDRGFRQESQKGERLQNLLWSAITCHPDLTFYVLPSPRPDIIKFDRFAHFDADARLYTHPENTVLDIYEFEGVNEGGVMGSCPTFRTRRDITAEIRDDNGTSLCSYSDVMERWGRSLVVVASQWVRNMALTGTCHAEGVHGENENRYYLLEQLGRARRNGLTSGTNLPYLSVDQLGVKSKLLYYIMKILNQQKLARKQMVHTKYRGQGATMNLLHLQRFYRALPDRVKALTSRLCRYLSSQHNNLQLLSVVKDTFNMHRKSLFKSVITASKDSLSVKVVPYRQVYPDAPSSDYLVREKGGAEKQLRVVVLTKEYRADDDQDEEEGGDDDKGAGDSEEACGMGIACVWVDDNYKGSEPLLQQLYGLVHSCGAGGIGLGDMMRQLKLNYRTVRNAAKCLVSIGMVKDILKSCGVRRFSVYVAKPFLECGAMSFGKALTEFQEKTTETKAAASGQQSDSTDPDTSQAAGRSVEDAPQGEGAAAAAAESSSVHQPSRPHCLLLDQSDEVLMDMTLNIGSAMSFSQEGHSSSSTTEKTRNSQLLADGDDDGDNRLGAPQLMGSSIGGGGGGGVGSGNNNTEDPILTSSDVSAVEEIVDLNEAEMKAEDVGEDDNGGGGGGGDKEEAMVANLPDIQCTVTEGIGMSQYKHTALPISKDRLTERMLTLANALLDSLRKCRLLDCVAATRRAINKQMSLASASKPSLTPSTMGKPMKTGVVDEVVCQKTVARIIEWCQRENKLKTFSVTLQYQNKVVKFVLVCATDVEKDDPIVLRAIQQHKLRNFAFTATKEIRKLKPGSLLDWSQMVCCALRAVATPFDPRKYQQHMNKWKKWEKGWWLHRFVWYVMHGYQGNTASHPLEPVQIEGVEGDEVVAEPPVYLDTDDWRRYVPPVKRHSVEGVSQEVCTIGDLFMVMPLSIFAPLTNMQEIPVVREYLMDAQQRHYPVTALPLTVLGAMLQNRIYIMPVLDVFRNLCALGLIAVGPMLASPNRVMQPVYVRKTALLLDTRESLPGNLFTVLPPGGKEFPEIKFDLNTMDDVLRYWATLQTVAFNTDLNNTGMTDKVSGDTELHPMKECMSYRSFTDIIHQYCLPGNRLGAAGADSGLFIHFRRNWSMEQINRTVGLRKKSQRGIDRGQLTASIAASGRHHGRSETGSQKKSATSSSSKEGGGKTVGRPKKNVMQKLCRGPLTVSQNSFHPLPAKYRTPRIGKRSNKDLSLPENQKKKGRPLFDEVDMQASKVMKGRRCRFSAKEVSMMLLGKVGLTYLCGEYSNQSYTVPIRDVMHQRLPASRDKTTAAIYYCIHRQLKRPNVRLSMDRYLLTMINDKELDRKYRQKVKIKNKITQCTDEYAALIRDLMSELIDQYTVFETKHCDGVLPRSLPLLGERYQVMLPDAGRKFTPFADVSSYTDICSVALRDFQLSHVLSVGDKQMRDYEMYVTLKQYNDQVVTDTFTRLVHGGLLSRNKKYMDHGSRMTGIARYMLNHKYQVILQTARHPVNLFTSCSQLLTSLMTTAATDQQPEQQEQVVTTAATDQQSEQEVMTTAATDQQSKQQQEVMTTAATDQQQSEQQQEVMTTLATDQQPEQQQEVMTTSATDQQQSEQQEVMTTTATDQQQSEQQQEVMATADTEQQPEQQQEVMATAATDQQPEQQQEVMTTAATDQQQSEQQQEVMAIADTDQQQSEQQQEVMTTADTDQQQPEQQQEGGHLEGGRGGGGGGQTETIVHTPPPPPHPPSFHPLPQGTATAGHAALVIGLTALDKLQMRLETNAEILNVHPSKNISVTARGENNTGDGIRGHKRGLGDDEERLKEDDDDDTADEVRCPNSSEPAAKKQRTDKADSASDHRETSTTHPSPTATITTTTPPPARKRKRSLSPLSQPGGDNNATPNASPREGRKRKRSLGWSDSSSEDEEEEGEEEEECASSSTPKSSRKIFMRPASDIGGLFITQLQAGQGVRKEAGSKGEMWMDRSRVSVRFCNRTGLQPVHEAEVAKKAATATSTTAKRKRKDEPIPGARASFTLLALRRTNADCKVNPRLPTSANRLTLSLSHLSLALLDDHPSSDLHQSSPSVLDNPSLTHHQSSSSLPAPASDRVEEKLMPDCGDSASGSSHKAGPAVINNAVTPIHQDQSSASIDDDKTLEKDNTTTTTTTSTSSTAEATTTTTTTNTAETTTGIPAVTPETETQSVNTEPSPEPCSRPVPEWIRPSHSHSESGGGCGDGGGWGSFALVDRELMKKIVRQHTRRLPMAMDWEAWWEECRASMDETAYTACQAVNRFLVSAGPQGATWNQLKASVPVTVKVLYDSLQYLVDHDAVVRSGVTAYRFVSLANARSWLVHTLNNTRGRGSIPQVDQSDQLPLPEDADMEPRSTAVAQNSSGQQATPGGAHPTQDASHSLGADSQAPCARQGAGDGLLSGSGLGLGPGRPVALQEAGLPSRLEAEDGGEGGGDSRTQNTEGDSSPDTEHPVSATERGDAAGSAKESQSREGNGAGDTDAGKGHTLKTPGMGSPMETHPNRGTDDGATEIPAQNESNVHAQGGGTTEDSQDSGTRVGYTEVGQGGSVEHSQGGSSKDESEVLDRSSSRNTSVEACQDGSVGDPGSSELKISGWGKVAPTQRRPNKRPPAKRFLEQKEKEKTMTVQPTSTYAKIRLHSRSWRRPEGGLNVPLLTEFLRSLMFVVMKRPGSTLKSLGQHYRLLFSPVDLRDLLQILEDLGCVKMMMIPQRTTPPSLFSPRPAMTVTTGPDLLGASGQELLVEATVDCTHRLGQFFSFLSTRAAAASSS